MSRRERNDSTMGIERAAADHGRCLPHSASSAACRGLERRARWCRSRSPASRLHARRTTRAVSRQALVRRSDGSPARIFGSWSGHQAEGELGRGLRRDHGLGAGPAIAADNAVDLGGRPRTRSARARERPFSPAGIAQADRRREIRRRRIRALASARELRRRGLAHAVIEARNGDAAVLIVHRREDFGQHADRIERRRRHTCRNADRATGR